MSDEPMEEFGEGGFGGEEEEQEANEEMVSGNGREGKGFGTENEAKEREELGEVEKGSSVEMSTDRLSALPDSVLIHILFYLSMKEAARTSVLSRRWQFVWTKLTKLEFRETSGEMEKICKFVSRVYKTLILCGRNNWSYLDIEFRYDSLFASDVNHWVEFAAIKKVYGFSLLLNSSSCEDLFTLPQLMYSNSLLGRLWLRGCVMAPQRTIEWQSLTWLYLEKMELPQIVIEKILSACPALTDLLLGGCWGFNCLDVNAQRLDALEIADSKDGNSDPLLEISAPLTQYLLIIPYPKGRRWRLTNISCLVEANINFTGSDWVASSDDVMSFTKELLENVQHVKELELGRRCTEVLSMMAVKGWQLPQFMLRTLRVEAQCDEHNISGVLALLESSPNLETFVIDGLKPSGDSLTLGPAAKLDLDCDLLHLKTACIAIFPDPNDAGEPFMKLVQILLKRATILEKMTVAIGITTDYINVIQTLLGYPRSSKYAVISLC